MVMSVLDGCCQRLMPQHHQDGCSSLDVTLLTIVLLIYDRIMQFNA
jgi:hypothetical protein